MKKLSIVILNFNTTALTLDCIESVKRYLSGVDCEIIVVDNGSSEPFPPSDDYLVVRSKENLGFAKGNNLARKYCRGEYMLFLNSDTLMKEGTLVGTLSYMEKNKEIGALTCKIILPDGTLDKDARRSFPTPWIAVTHFSFLDRLFPKSRIFSGYWYGYKNEGSIHEIDVLQGAFFLTKKEVLDKVDWFSEEYFLDGEDIDLSWKIKSLGYKIVYYPKYSITHIKKATKGKTKRSLKAVMAGVDSMEIFYRKFLWSRYPIVVNLPVILGIKILKLVRFVKFSLFK